MKEKGCAGKEMRDQGSQKRRPGSPHAKHDLKRKKLTYEDPGEMGGGKEGQILEDSGL